MRFLFLHHNHPAQFVHLCTHLAENGHEVRFISETYSVKPAKGVKLIPIGDQAAGGGQVNEAFQRAGRFRKIFARLKDEGYFPDVVISHSGWSCGLHVKEIFPNTRLVQYIEWWFDTVVMKKIFEEFPSEHVGSLTIEQAKAYVRLNVPLSAEIMQADMLVCPTEWQKSMLPQIASSNTVVSHEGIETDFYRFNSAWKRNKGLLVFASRGLEPIRGFPDLVEAIAYIYRENKGARFLIIGEDRCCYRKSLVYKNGAKTWAAELLRREGVPEGVVKFMNFADKTTYARILKSCQAFLYLSRSFIPSWGLFNAMSSGTPIMALDSMMMRSLENEFGIRPSMTGSLGKEDLSQSIGRMMNGTDEGDHKMNCEIVRQRLSARRKVVEWEKMILEI